MSTKDYQILGDDWLVAYAAGTLSFGHEMVVGAHIELNETAKAKYAEVEAAGGALFEDLAPTKLDGALLDDLLDQISVAEPEETPAHIPSPQPAFLPKSVAEYFDSEGIELKWKTLGPGMKRFPILKGENDERVWLLKAKPGTPIPAHGHNGNEWTLILTGELQDGDMRFRRGDLEAADKSLDHQPIVAEGEDCICLVVTEGPIKLKGPFARLMQPFIGI